MADDAAVPEGEASASTSADESTDVKDDESTDVKDDESTGVKNPAAVGSEVEDTVKADAAELDESADPGESAEPDEADAVDAGDEAVSDDVSDEVEAPKSKMSHVGMALIAGLALVVALGGLTGWLGYRAYDSHKIDEQRKMFLQVGRQGALNLTTIDWQHAEGDVQRVLDSATGSFYDDFQQRSQPFIAVVKQAQSKSVGTVTEAGLESESGDEAKVLVAVTVQTSNAGAPDQQPRAWRMRITVKQDGDDAKVSNVEFVP